MLQRLGGGPGGGQGGYDDSEKHCIKKRLPAHAGQIPQEYTIKPTKKTQMKQLKNKKYYRPGHLVVLGGNDV